MTTANLIKKAKRPQKTQKNFFITIEGIDGSGKSTQAALLCDWLEKSRKDRFETGVLRTFEPGGWEGGALLRRLLLEGADLTPRTELLLFLADRSGHLDTVILPALRQGRGVVCERYTDSTLAYQCWGRGIAFEEVDGLMECCRFPVPDLTLLLDLDEAAAKARVVRRGKLDRIEAESDGGFASRVARGYRELARRWPERIAVLDASGEPGQVALLVRETVEKHLTEKSFDRDFDKNLERDFIQEKSP